VLSKLLVLTLFLFNTASIPLESSIVHYPPEWEPQSTVWLSWPSSKEACCKLLPAASNTVIADMAANLVGAVPFVTILINGPDDIAAVNKAMEERDINPVSHIRFVTLPHSEEWIRDFGPIFLRSTSAALSVASFGWNHWGCVDRYHYEGIELDCEEASLISQRCASELHLPVIHSRIISEGGNREFNGAGVLMATASVELQRNPGLTIEAIEMELKRVFNVQKVIWLGEGVADDDHAFIGPRRTNDDDNGLEFNAGCTGGHIDEYCKFLSPNTVLLAEVPEDERDSHLGKITHARMEHNLHILTGPSGGDVDGHPFKIIRIPTPPTIRITIEKDDPMWGWYESIDFENNGHPARGLELLASQSSAKVVLPASYVNMIMCNGTILIPRYGRKEGETKWSFISDDENERALKTDEMAREVLQGFYPSYKIIQIPSVLALNIGGGGMHCTSQQQPALLSN
jgi:agmatine deiminase